MSSYEQNFIAAKTQLASLEDATDWTATNGSVADDEVHFREGTQSVALTTTSGAFSTMTKTVSLDMSSQRAVRFSIYIPAATAITEVDTVALILATNTGFTSYFTSPWFSPDTLTGWYAPGQWITFSVAPGDWTETGSPSWDDTIVKLRFAVQANTGTTPTVVFDDCYSVVSTPVVWFSFDDGYSSVLDRAYPILADHGFAGTLYIPKSTIGTANYMTEANLSTLYDAGWTIGNHGAAHASQAAATYDQCLADIVGGQAYLDGLGLTRGSRHFAFPLGVFGDYSMQACADAGVFTARITGGMHSYAPFADARRVAVKSLGSGVTLAAAKVWVDEAVAHGCIVGLMAHKIVESSPGSGDWTEDDFEALVTYVDGLGIDVLTIEEIFAATQEDAPAEASAALFTVAEARAFDKGQLASLTKYPDADIVAKEAEIRDWLERLCAVNFVPTPHTETHDGDGSDYLMLKWPKVTAVSAISEDGTALTAGDLSTTDYSDGLAIDGEKGIITRRSDTFDAGWQNISVTYTAGHATVPDRVKRVALRMCVAEMPASNVPFAADDYDAGGMSVSFGRGDGFGGAWHRDPEVVAVIRAYGYNAPGIA